MNGHAACACTRVVAMAALLCAGARADTQTVVELDPVVVSARGRATPVRGTPGGVGVIAPDAGLAAVGVADVVDALPGVETSADGAWGSDVNIRGLSRDSVVMLLDGCRVNTFTDLGARFGCVDPMAVERVEVLKGPISSLYGSGSIGGVVNVITRAGRFAEATGVHGGLSARYDSVSDGADVFGYAGVDSPRAYALAGQSWRGHGDYRDGSGDEVHNSGFRDAHTLVRAGVRPSPALRIEANVQRFDGREIGIPGSGTAPLPAAADVTYERIATELYALSATVNPGFAAWPESRLVLCAQRVERRVRIDAFPAASPLAEVRPGADHQTYGLRWQNTLAPAAGHTAALGADVWQWSVDSDRTRRLKNGTVQYDQPLPDALYRSAGVFVEDEWRPVGRLAVSAGGRLDAIRVENETGERWPEGDVDETGWDAHAGLVWDAFDALAVKALAGTGYRAATLSERFQYLELGGGRVKLGDPELDPERSTLLEVGLECRRPTYFAGASVYYNRLEDMIGESFEDPAVVRAENINRAEIYGAEVEGWWNAAEWLRLEAQAAYPVGRDTRRNEHLAGIPPFTGAIGVRAELGPGWWVRLGTDFAGPQDRTPAGVEETAAWATAGVRIGYERTAGRTAHRITVGVENLFDAAYRNYLATYRGAAFNEPGRSFVAGYAGTF